MRLLLRSGKHPLQTYSARRTYAHNVFGNNSGNLLFSHAVHRALSTPGTTIDSTRLKADHREAARINDEYDAFVVPLANAFRRTFMPQLGKLTDLIEKLTIPVVVVGVGAQSTANYSLDKLAPFDDQVRRFVGAVLDRSATIGVRGEFTLEYLRHLGFDAAEVIGCPAMFMHGPHLNVTRKVDALNADSPLAIGISPYVQEMAAVVDRNRRHYNDLVYVAQDIASLGRALGPTRGGTPSPETGPDAAPDPWKPLYDEGKVRFFVDPAPWLEWLAGRHFSYGTRIHGAIAALVAGTPATVLAHDSRTLELARYHQIPHVDRRRIGPELNPAHLFVSADLGPLHSGHAERFRVYAEFLERNGLRHVFEPGMEQGAVDFDRQVAATRYPEAVQPLVGRQPWLGRRAVSRLVRRPAASQPAASEPAASGELVRAS